MEFVQKAIFSSNGISQDLVNLLSAVGEEGVTTAIQEARNKEQLKGLMLDIIPMKFISLSQSAINSNSPSKLPYQSMEKALKQLPHFTSDSNFYQDLQTKEKKLAILLESVTFVEAATIIKLITRDYDFALIKRILNAETKTKTKKDEIK